ncbi:hypothetical protein F3N42_08475 [Marinihelvus fidelis]|uniref:FlgO domain-containing protein n=1 Tax=Marinihelvus fidelis TaxID=2613842 RepID=A0A5N0T9E3_9GAMM|nr:hypothetical protein [Marinihelvus fidelis]KAA9131348.1 hypothetical protein F3N42_08475 [Marinihelvus fidelis]
MSFFAELKRRNVFRVGIAYVLVAWIVLQGIDFLVDLIDAPAWVLQIFFAAAAIGLLSVLIFSWVFEMTPEGLKKERDIDRDRSIAPQTGRKLDRVIIAFLAIAVVVLLVERFSQPARIDEPVASARSTSPTADSAEAPTNAPPKKSLAVLPFVALSNGPDDEFFADGLTEEILNSLAQLPELRVTARTSAFAFKGQDLPVQEIGETLGVGHVVEGSVRRAGERLRVTAQLVQAEDGFHLWSKNYDRDYGDTIAIQEDIAEQIAAALDVVMDEGKRDSMRRVGLRDPAAFIAWQKGTLAAQIAHGTVDQIPGLLEANAHFEEVLEHAPDYAPAWVAHSDPYGHILNDSATGESSLDDVPESMVNTALQMAANDLAKAAEHATGLDERAGAELDLAILTGDFYDIRRRLEAYLASEGCDHAQWVDPVATVFGFAEQVIDRLGHVTACDPLWSTVVFSRARAALWNGQTERARDIIAMVREQSSHPWLDLIQVRSYIIDGQLESARAEIDQARSMDPFWRKQNALMLAAASGDRDNMTRLVELAYEDGSRSGFFDLQFHAMSGDREAANRVAARIDQDAYGPLPLILIINWCMCGAPFDLEATPNLAAEIAEGGLPWPPAEIINFPLKQW